MRECFIGERDDPVFECVASLLSQLNCIFFADDGIGWESTAEDGVDDSLGGVVTD